MKNKQEIVIVRPKAQDQTAWQAYKQEHPELKGQRYYKVIPKQPTNYVFMVVVMLVSICAVPYIASKFDKLMHDPLFGLIGTGLIILVLIKLFQGFEKNYG